jgi:hypothetical protein
VTIVVLYMLVVGVLVYGLIIHFSVITTATSYSLTADSLEIKDRIGELIFSARYDRITDVRMINRNLITNAILMIDLHFSIQWDYSNRTFGKGVLVTIIDKPRFPNLGREWTRRVLLTPDDPEVFVDAIRSCITK